jgi:hypothetical protein
MGGESEVDRVIRVNRVNRVGVGMISGRGLGLVSHSRSHTHTHALTLTQSLSRSHTHAHSHRGPRELTTSLGKAGARGQLGSCSSSQGRSHKF